MNQPKVSSKLLNICPFSIQLSSRDQSDLNNDSPIKKLGSDKKKKLQKTSSLNFQPAVLDQSLLSIISQLRSQLRKKDCQIQYLKSKLKRNQQSSVSKRNQTSGETKVLKSLLSDKDRKIQILELQLAFLRNKATFGKESQPPKNLPQKIEKAKEQRKRLSLRQRANTSSYNLSKRQNPESQSLKRNFQVRKVQSSKLLDLDRYLVERIRI